MRCAGVRVRRRASVALPVSWPAGIEPSAPTTTAGSAASKNALPSELVVEGPEKLCRDVRRVVRQRRVELGQRRQPYLGELVEVEAADRGDELAGRHASRAVAEGPLDVGDGIGVLQRRVPPGPVAHQDDVVVVVDDARDGGAAAQVDRPGAVGHALLRLAEAVAGVRDAAVVDGQHADDAPAAVHRVDLSIVEDQGALGVVPAAAVRAGRCRSGDRADRGRGADDCSGLEHRSSGNAFLFSRTHLWTPSSRVETWRFRCVMGGVEGSVQEVTQFTLGAECKLALHSCAIELRAPGEGGGAPDRGRRRGGRRRPGDQAERSRTNHTPTAGSSVSLR